MEIPFVAVIGILAIGICWSMHRRKNKDSHIVAFFHPLWYKCLAMRLLIVMLVVLVVAERECFGLLSRLYRGSART